MKLPNPEVTLWGSVISTRKLTPTFWEKFDRLAHQAIRGSNEMHVASGFWGHLSMPTKVTMIVLN